jgi:hypothetical protein
VNLEGKLDPEVLKRIDRALDILERAVSAWENFAGVFGMAYARLTDALDKKAANGNTGTAPRK